MYIEDGLLQVLSQAQNGGDNRLLHVIRVELLLTERYTVDKHLW